MIHQYKLGGYNIVLDVCSGGLHVVDDLSYDIRKNSTAPVPVPAVRPKLLTAAWKMA